MPRRPRLKSSSGIYHVILRGNNKQNIFQEEEDYSKFLYLIKHFKEDINFHIYSYCLMTNHIHLLIKETSTELSIVMKHLAGTYAKWYNNKYAKVGHLFQGRYGCKAVENEQYFWTVIFYIHMNPLKEGMCKELQEYGWSSYRDYLSNYGITDTNAILLKLDYNQDQAIASFINLHKDAITSSTGLDCEDQISDERLIKEIKERFDIDITNLREYPEAETKRLLIRLLKVPSINKSKLSRLTGISRSKLKKLEDGFSYIR